MKNYEKDGAKTTIKRAWMDGMADVVASEGYYDRVRASLSRVEEFGEVVDSALASWPDEAPVLPEEDMDLPKAYHILPIHTVGFSFRANGVVYSLSGTPCETFFRAMNQGDKITMIKALREANAEYRDGTLIYTVKILDAKLAVESLTGNTHYRIKGE